MNKLPRSKQSKPPAISAQEQAGKQHQPHTAIQPKMALTQPKQPTAPQVYRPQPIPKVLQQKPAVKQEPPAVSPKPSAPPAYRPQPVPKILQAKMKTAEVKDYGRRPATPPASKPQGQSATMPKQAAINTSPTTTHHHHTCHDKPTGRAGATIQRAFGGINNPFQVGDMFGGWRAQIVPCQICNQNMPPGTPTAPTPCCNVNVHTACAANVAANGCPLCGATLCAVCGGLAPPAVQTPCCHAIVHAVCIANMALFGCPVCGHHPNAAAPAA